METDWKAVGIRAPEARFFRTLRRSDAGNDPRMEAIPTNHRTLHERSPLASRRVLAGIRIADDLVHLVIALLLLALALSVIGTTVSDFLEGDGPFVLRVTYAVNGVLFVIILMEILRTVVAHFTHGTFQLMPFIAIGIISAVRHILTVGSALTLGTTLEDTEFNRLLLELGVNTGVALGLVVALVLLRGRRIDDDSEQVVQVAR